MKRLFLILVYLVSALFLTGFVSRKSEEPTIKMMTVEDFLLSHKSKGPMCYSCVTTEGNLIDHCLIKGNINKKKYIYHCPNWRDYDNTDIDLSKGERYFYTEEEALSSGWREPKYKKDKCHVGNPAR